MARSQMAANALSFAGWSLWGGLKSALRPTEKATDQLLAVASLVIRGGLESALR